MKFFFRRLDITYGLNGTVLQWLNSDLVGRCQQVRTVQLFVTLCSAGCRMQGSVLGLSAWCCSWCTPLNCYNSLRVTAFVHSLCWQCRYINYATTELQSLQIRLSAYIDHVAEWMRSNRLQLNAAKTEVPCNNQSSATWLAVVIASCWCWSRLTPPVLRNLGIFIDAVRHIDEVTCFAILRQPSCIQRSVPQTVLQSLMSSLVLIRLECYAVSYRWSHSHAAAIMIYSTSCFIHNSPFLRQVHWFKACARIDYTI